MSSNPSQKKLVINTGIAIGPAHVFSDVQLDSLPKSSGNSAEEQQALIAAIKEASVEITEIKRLSLEHIGEKEASIFDAHLLILSDPDLLEKTSRLMNNKGCSAAYAWQICIDEYAMLFRSMDSKTMAERAADVDDVGKRVLRKLLSSEQTSINPSSPSILVTDELSPSDTALINPEKVLGIVCSGGGGLSHSAILVRALGIPAIFGVGEEIASIAHGSPLILDAGTCTVYANPEPAILKEYQVKHSSWQEMRNKLDVNKLQPAITLDNKKVEVFANVSSADEVRIALKNGAEGIGLFRTEFLYMNRNRLPDEEEQFSVYAKSVENAHGKPVVFRTMDIGGDKAVSHLGIHKETNPFLGLRGVRYSLKYPMIFKTQVRAMLRASAFGQVSIMFPMVSTLQEWRDAKKLFEECTVELEDQKIPFNIDTPVGIMVETPASVLGIDVFLAEVDFISIGTNDLTQYVMATDRENQSVGDLASHFQPAVLKSIRLVLDASLRANKPVAMCGEMAGDLSAAAFLLGCGLRTFSMSSSKVPEFKEHVRGMNTQVNTKMVQKMNNALILDDVRRIVNSDVTSD